MYRQNFKHFADSFSMSGNKSITIHKFAHKYCFKGSRNEKGKLIKMAIKNYELAKKRCTTAFDCYNTLRDILSKNEEEKEYNVLYEYEFNRNIKLLQNTTYTTRCTYLQYTIENHKE